MTTWRAWVQSRYLSRRGADALDWRPRFMAVSLMFSVLLLLLLIVAYLAVGNRSGAVVLGCFALAALVMLEVSRHLSTWVSLQVLLTLTALAEVVLLVMEPTLDTALLLWLGMLPVLASLVLDWRAGAAWLVLAFLIALAFLELRPTAAPMPALHLVRLTSFVLTCFLFVFLFDVSRRRALEAAQAATRAKSAFLATMSHEIRTPMNGVLGMAEVMLQGTLSGEQREQLGIIQRSGQALVALINDILDLSKVEAQRLELDAQPFSLTGMLAELHQLYATLASQRGLTLQLACDPEVPAVVRGDGLRLRQVLGNLLGNAVKFTERGGVTLGVSRSPDDRLRFAVTDTGVGISPEGLASLFEPFQQVDSSPTRRFGGTGLGLALSRQLVRLMGGELTVHSAVGRGSTLAFELALPEATLAPVAAPAPREDEGPPLARGRTVLVVDDNPVNVAVASALVRRSGFEVEVARDGVEAVEALERRPFALVLMDCHMPRMDGFEATARIRALALPAARTPIVALTASAMPEELEACRRAGMDECLTKPLVLAQLRRMLRRFAGAYLSPSGPLPPIAPAPRSDAPR